MPSDRIDRRFDFWDLASAKVSSSAVNHGDLQLIIGEDLATPPFYKANYLPVNLDIRMSKFFCQIIQVESDNSSWQLMGDMI